MKTPKLRPEVKKKLLAALRSGKYKQARGALRKEKDGQYSYCCLGVLCDLHSKITKKGGNRWRGTTYHVSDVALPEAVIKWAFTPKTLEDFDNDDLSSPVLKNNISLIDYNDDKKYSFKKIADLIENQL